MDDCWIFHKGSPAFWKKTWNLPKPLYRHSAVRLPGSSLSLIVGGKTGPADVSSDAYVFHLDKGWLICELSMDSSRPQVFGAALCNSSTPASERGCFEGILFGGMKKDGTLNRTPYWWHLQWRGAKPRLTFKEMDMHPSVQGALSVFGASVAHVGSKVVICGGTGDEPSVQGQHMTLLGITTGQVQIVGRICPFAGSTEWPFMIGSSVLSSGRQFTVLGGGAVCFSMGSFWETRQWRFALPSGNDYQEPAPAHIWCKFLESPKILGKSQDTDATPHSEEKGPTIVQIPTLKLTSNEQFRKLLQDGKPVVIKGLNIGVCLSNWTPEYMVEQVGREKQVSLTRDAR
jgi:tRNA wybutosine-synthesizing protein 4